MKIVWTDDLSVGVDVIDKQHQQFIEIVNELYAAMDENRADDIIEKLLEELTAYAEYHFATEEKYFEMFKYKFTDEHVALHKEMLRKLAHLTKQKSAGNKQVVVETLMFLEEWLTNHLKNEDHKYADCFHDHGLV